MVPVIGLTAHAHSTVKKKCMKSGMQDVFSKPISKKLLQTIMITYLEKQQFPASTTFAEVSVMPAKTGMTYDYYEKYLIFDEANIHQRMKNRDTIIEIVSLFLEHDLKRATQLRLLWEPENQLEQFTEIVHKINGGAIYCSTPRLQHISEALELYLLENKFKTVKNLCPVWMFILMQTKQTLELFLSEINKT